MNGEYVSNSSVKKAAVPVVIYYREGTEAYDVDIAEQREACSRFVKDFNGHVLIEYREQGSGTDANRPLLKAAAERAKKEGAIFLVADVNVLTRVPQFGIEFCQEYNVRIAKYPKANNVELSTCFLMLQQERELISTRTREALQAKIANGEKLGRPKLKDGERGKYVKRKGTRKCEFSSEALEKVNTLHRAGVKPSKIAAVLNEINQESARGGKWYTTTVTLIIRKYLQNTKI